MHSQDLRAGKCAAAPHPSVAVRDRGHCKGVAGSGSVELVVVRPHADGKVFVPGCASKAGLVRAGEEPEELKRFGSHTFVPTSWMCKKQTSVLHSSTESEIISLDAGFRLDGIPALALWDLIVLVLGNTIQTYVRTEQPVVYCDKDHGPNKRSQGMINVLNNIDCVPSNVQFSHQEALLYVFEDNEAAIKIIIKGRSPTMRHVSRTHRVALDWFFDRINLDPRIQIKYIDTKNQLADIPTEGNFTRDEWNHLL